MSFRTSKRANALTSWKARCNGSKMPDWYILLNSFKTLKVRFLHTPTLHISRFTLRMSDCFADVLEWAIKIILRTAGFKPLSKARLRKIMF
ncbi:MAG: hypothetical protein VZQ51_04655 [Bacteroidales bacterium]|nr:hypothetical protein [Bacteroidales bacterium]